MKKAIIKFFGLKGSWSWAKKQMLNGKIVRCKHWSGTLKLRIDSKENTLLQCSFQRFNKQMLNRNQIWETSNHHLSFEDFVDYEVVDF